VLDVTSLDAGYGHVQILRDVSLRVEKSETVALVGPNGAGKSTLVRALCGLNPATSGRIVINGVDITNEAPHLRGLRGVSVILENRRLFGELTVRDNLKLAEKAGLKRQCRQRSFTWDSIGELFSIVPEKRNVRVELLSGGQQQMIAIARALLMQPDLLILDEPSTGLAPKVVEEILCVLSNLRSGGLAILIAEQNLTIATAMADRGYVMSLGRIVHHISGLDWKNAINDGRLASAYLQGV
jgi:ABC-type branched-subunit amino acid transport system ATPase component